jgi:hypothetical protein
VGERHGVANRGQLGRVEGVRQQAGVHRGVRQTLRRALPTLRPRGIATDGQPYENTYAFFMQMRDGKVIDVTALTDSISLNDLLERVQPASQLDS